MQSKHCSQKNVTPLMVASRNGHLDVVLALLKENAKTDAKDIVSNVYLLCLNVIVIVSAKRDLVSNALRLNR